MSWCAGPSRDLVVGGISATSFLAEYFDLRRVATADGAEVVSQLSRLRFVYRFQFGSGGLFCIGPLTPMVLVARALREV